MKNVLFFFVAYLIHSNSISQQVFNPTYGKFEILNRKFTIKSIIDARPNKELGFIGKDSTNAMMLVCEKSIEETLLPFLNYCSGKIGEKNTDLTLKINKFYFGTREVKGETWASVYADIEFYIQQDSLYFKIFELNSSIEGADEKSIELLVAKTNWHFWKVIITNLNKINLKKKLENAEKTNFSEIFNPKTLSLIFTDSPLNEGVYTTFNEFLNNKPSFKNLRTTFIRNEIQLYYKDVNGVEWNPRFNNEAWGFCKNGKVFHAFDRGNLSPVIYLPIQRFGNNLEITEKASKFIGILNTKRESTLLNTATQIAFSNYRGFGYAPSAIGIGLAGINLLLAAFTPNPNQRIEIDMTTGKSRFVPIYSVIK